MKRAGNQKYSLVDVIKLLDDEGSEKEERSSDEDEWDELPDNANDLHSSMDSSSSDDDENSIQQSDKNDPDTGILYISKNKKETWSTVPVRSNTGRNPKCNIVKTPQGLTAFTKKNCNSLASTFNLFFRSKLMDIICKWTNKEGNVVVPNWKLIEKDELQSWLGILILIGVYKS